MASALPPAFYNDFIVTPSPSTPIPPPLVGDIQEEDEDDDPKRYLQLLGLLSRTNDSSQSLNDIIADLHLSQPVSEDQVLTFIVSVLGLVLNISLLIVMFCVRRQSWRLRNQRLFVALLASAYTLLCFVLIAEFMLLKMDAARFIISCLILFKKRTVKYLSLFLVMGSVLGCATDNYLAVCKPIYHRIYTSRIVTWFAVSCTIYCSAATLLTLSDFILPLNLESNCTTSSHVSRQVQGVYFSFAYLASAGDFENYCRNIEDCLLTTSTMEISVLVGWVAIVIPVSFFYIKTAVVLRASLNNLFAPSLLQTTPRSSTVAGNGHGGRTTTTTATRPRCSSENGGSLLASSRQRCSLQSIEPCVEANNHASKNSNSGGSLSLSSNNKSRLHAPIASIASIGLESIMENGDEESDRLHAQRFRTVSDFRMKSTEDENGDTLKMKLDYANSNNSTPAGSDAENDDQPQESPKLTSPTSPVAAPRAKRKRSSLPNRQLNNSSSNGELRIRLASPTFDDLPMLPVSPTARANGARRFSFISFISSNGGHYPSQERRVSVSQAQTLHLLRNRRRSSNTQIIILAIFITTWIPEITFQISNKLFFTEGFRTEYFPHLLPVVKYFDLFILLNAIIDPILYGTNELQRTLCRFLKRRF